MNVYCVMRGDARTDLDHVVYATTSKADAERFANTYDYQYIEVLDVVESEYIEIENPCYHCYTGAIGECSLAGCRHQLKSWSQDVEHETIEIIKEA